MDKLRHLEFMCNASKAEVDVIKRMFSVQKLQQIDATQNKVNDVVNDLEVIKVEKEMFATKSEVD